MNTGRPPWTIRRRIVHATLIFCAACVAFLLWKGEDSALNQAIANGAFLLAGSVIGAFVFGAVWDDKNVMSAFGQSAYNDLGVSAPPLSVAPAALTGWDPAAPSTLTPQGAAG